MADGPGFRTSIYCAGCGHHCPGCHNPQSWDFNGGRQVSVDELLEVVKADEYLEGEWMQISIFMSVTNVHMNWVPVGGVVEYFKYHPGKFLVAWHPKSSTDNERTTTVVETKSGVEVLFRQIAGFVARRIVSYVKVDEQVDQNSVFGFIKFGSRIDILLPKDAKLLVEIGDSVVGTQTPIARIGGVAEESLETPGEESLETENSELKTEN